MIFRHLRVSIMLLHFPCLLSCFLDYSRDSEKYMLLNMGRWLWVANLIVYQLKAIVPCRGLATALQLNVFRQAITNPLKRWKFQRGYLNIKSTNSPRITDLITDRNSLQSVHRNPRLTANNIAREISTPDKATPWIHTIGKRLRTAGLFGRRAVQIFFCFCQKSQFSHSVDNGSS